MKAENRTNKKIIDYLRELGGMPEKSDAGSGDFDEKMRDLGVREKESTIKWRAWFSIFIMILLVVQYGVVVFFLLTQGFSWQGFNLANRIFYILIGGTLAESYLLVRIIFQYLFSSKK